ncbi:MAG: glycosyltransferase family 2 protein [Methylobacter sp.]
MERSRIAIIVPALNEAATIGAVLARVKEYGLPIVVDDGSTDATAALAREAGAEVVTHQKNQGYDGALNSGFARAAALDCAYAITIDADGQHNPAQLQELINYLDQGYELVLGARDRYQRIGEVIFAYCTKRLWNISDPLCGMKGYSLDLYNKAGHFDSFQSIGTELAVRSLVNGCRHIEMPVITRDRQDEPRFARKFAANYKILRAMLILVLRYSMNKLKN